MSFQENTDDDSYVSESGWENTGSESNLKRSDTRIERSFVDDEPDATNIDEDWERYLPELRARHAVAAYDDSFPCNSTLAPDALDTCVFANRDTGYPNNGYLQELAGYSQQLILDDDSAIDPRTTLNQLSNLTATIHTPGQLETRNREPRAKLSPTAQNLLQVFFESNPYPTLDNKQALAQLTEMSTIQVETWFRNSRQRKWPHSTSVSSTLPLQGSVHIGQNAALTGQHQGYEQYAQRGAYDGSVFTSTVLENSGIASYPSNPQGYNGGYGRQSPSLQAYCNVPPRDDVQPIISSASVIGGFQTPQISAPTMAAGQRMGQEGESSESWVDVPETAGLQSYSMSRESTRMSSASNSNMMGPSSTPGRQGRRRGGNIKEHPRERDPLKIYQCTWCCYPFKTSSDMGRHMETQHAPQTAFTCMPEGLASLRVFNESNQQICVLCSSLETNDNHFSTAHNALPCIQKPFGKRSFSRKDHLVRHIEQSHHKDKNSSLKLTNVVEGWKIPICNSVSWYCGFCQRLVYGWLEYINHIREHFQHHGLDMTSWIDSSGRHH